MAGHVLSERDPVPKRKKGTVLRHTNHRDAKHWNRMGRIMRGASRH